MYRIAGKGTQEFSQLQEGDTIEIMGPLGNGFSKSEKRILVDYALAMQVGGIWNSDRLKFGEPL